MMFISPLVNIVSDDLFSSKYEFSNGEKCWNNDFKFMGVEIASYEVTKTIPHKVIYLPYTLPTTMTLLNNGGVHGPSLKKPTP